MKNVTVSRNSSLSIQSSSVQLLYQFWIILTSGIQLLSSKIEDAKLSLTKPAFFAYSSVVLWYSFAFLWISIYLSKTSILLGASSSSLIYVARVIWLSVTETTSKWYNSCLDNGSDKISSLGIDGKRLNGF